MHVVAAGVHHRDFGPVLAGGPDRARVRQAGLLLDGERVEVGPEHHHRTVAVAQQPDDAGAADLLGDLEAQRPQARGHALRGPVLLERQFGMLVQVPVKVREPGAELLKPGPDDVRHEFRSPRKGRS